MLFRSITHRYTGSGLTYTQFKKKMKNVRFLIAEFLKTVWESDVIEAKGEVAHDSTSV